MNKEDLITKIAAKQNITKLQAQKEIEHTLDGIISVMKNGERLTLVGFGSFHLWNRAPRKARNPLTGVVVDVPEKNYVSFSAGESFREAVNLKKALEGAKKAPTTKKKEKSTKKEVKTAKKSKKRA